MAYTLPSKTALRNSYELETIGQDGVHILTQIYGAAAPAALRASLNF